MSGNRLKPLRVWTAVWGATHMEWFEKFCLRSLAWAKNKAALEGATWSFLTKGEHVEHLKALVSGSGIKIRDTEFVILGPEFDVNPHAAGMFMKEGYIVEMGKCITFGAQSLTAPPDTIFGDGSISYMREVGRQRDTVVFAAHIRVLPGIEQALTFELSNAELVDAGMFHAHKTWSEAQDGLEMVNSYIGGISWKYLDRGLYAVTHRLPTPYLINFTPEDLVYFKNQIHYGILDHSWPAACLIETERQRVIGSSDGAFMVEVTPAESNIPPVAPYHEDSPDHFWRNLSHNKVNRLFSIIFRGTQCE